MNHSRALPAEGLTREAEYVMKTADQRGVRFVRLWFVDVLGILKSVAVPASELESALTEGVAFDGSALEGTLRGRERDVVALPDPTTFQVVPWSDDANVARMFCDIRTIDDEPSPGDSRQILKTMLHQAAELGYTVNVAAEIEFFLFDGDPEGGLPPRPLDFGSYFDLTPLDAGTRFRRRTIEHLEMMGIPVTGSHHEAAPSQHEVDLAASDPLAMADAITTFRIAVKEVAREGNAFATFMPKPLPEQPGSGLHLHLALFEDDADILRDPSGEKPLSALGANFLAGVLAHAREFSALTNQWSNSYKRLVPGFEAPESVAWTVHGRSTLARIPVSPPSRSAPVRIELRLPDPGCNPYLALASVLGAGLRGIERGYELSPPDVDSPLTPPLPSDLREAVEALDRSDFIRDLLGDRVVDGLRRNKLGELEAERRTISAHEHSTLLRLL